MKKGRITGSQVENRRIGAWGYGTEPEYSTSNRLIRCKKVPVLSVQHLKWLWVGV